MAPLHRPLTTLLLAALAVPLLAGCLGQLGPLNDTALGEDGAGDRTRIPAVPGGPSGYAVDELPPGCDANRTAVAHLPGGVLVADPPHAPPVPCLTRTGYTSAEPTLGVASDGTVFLYPALPSFSITTPVGVARTTDDGATWERIVPDLLGQPTHPTTLDPYMYLDPATDRVFVDDLAPAFNCSYLSWSDDLGETWDHSLAGCMEFDHQTIFAGPPTISPTVGYPNVVHRCAINTVALAGASFSATCQRSLDGGLTWLAPGEPAFVADPTREGHGRVPGYCDGALGHGFVGDDGTVYLPKGFCGQPFLAISDTEGLTWTRVQVATNGMNAYADGTQGHEAGVAADADGNVYYLWVARDRLPYLATSRDGGETWSEPLMVGPPGLTQAALPALIVGGTGKVAVAYMGSTNAPPAPHPMCDSATDCLMGDNGDERDYADVTWNGYLGVTVNALDDEPLFYSAPVNDPDDPLIRGQCPPIRCQEVFDFIDVRVGPDGTPWAPYVDGCTGACATGEEMTDNDDEGVAGRLWGGPSLVDGGGGEVYAAEAAG